MIRKLVLKVTCLFLAIISILGCFVGCDDLSEYSQTNYTSECSHTNYSWVIAKQATYNETGLRRAECKDCGALIKTEIISKKKCTHFDSKWIVEVEPSYHSYGSRYLKCNTCGSTVKTEQIPQKTCSHSNSEWVVDAQPTFDKEGIKNLICNTCGATVETQYIPKIECAHTNSNWVIDIEATLQKEGSKHLECTVCGANLKTETIPKETCNHANATWITDVQPTYSNEGSKRLHCSTCGVDVKAETIPKLSCQHANTKWKIFSFPTYEVVGVAYNECTDCGAIIESVFLPKLGCEHTYTKWVIDKEPTSFSNGSKHLECITCGENLKTETIYRKELSQYEIESKLRDSVVKVICYDYDGKTQTSQGSGFFIDDKGTFITNAHVVENCFYIKVKDYLNREINVDVMYVYNGTMSDYAICKIDGFYTSKPVEFVESASVGDTVYALGFPKDASYLQITKGKITNTNVISGSKHFYENTARIDHGSSGGVLCDAYGRVLGITTGDGQYTDYLALKYQDFKLDVEKKHTGSKTPFEYFHKIEEVRLDSYNAGNYFDVYVNGTFTSDTRISYEVVVALKEKYRNSKFLIDGSSIRVTLDLDTIIEYQEITSYGTYNKSTNKDTSLSFNFNDKEDLFEGKEVSETVSFWISANDYYITNAYYEIEFSSVSGTLEFYL